MRNNEMPEFNYKTRSICFNGKYCVKIVFYIFQCLVALEKNKSKENYLWST